METTNDNSLVIAVWRFLHILSSKPIKSFSLHLIEHIELSALLIK